MDDSQPPGISDPFEVGRYICWLHGEHYRVARVLAVEEDRVFLSGLTADYWLSKKSLLPRLDVTPHRISGFF